MASVSFSRRDEEWSVRGEYRPAGPSGQLVLVQEDLNLVSAFDLRNALASMGAFYGPEHSSSRAYADVSLLPEDYFDADAPCGPVGFELVGSQLVVTATCFMDGPDSGDEGETVAKTTRLIEPLLRDARSKLDRIAVNDSWSAPTHVAVDLRIAVPWRGKMAADLLKVGEAIVTLCNTFVNASITRETVADLVRGGGAHLLIGQPEGNWLDAKAEEYDLTTTKGKISLAMAVARFANAEDGGLLIIGAKAKKIPGGEVITQIDGVAPRHRDTAARYLRVVDQHLYPPLYGIRIELVSTSGELGLILIDIPPQPEEFKPFLVHGAITADGDTEGSFISIVQRRGEASIPITAPMIHAALAAGRALLRGTSSGVSDEP